jgi:hypothetical protein
VNNGILKDKYLGETISVQYSTVDNLIDLIKKKGKDCQLFKRDLKRVYRHIYLDPGEIHRLGYKWRGHIYFDRVLTMDLRSATYICMINTSAIRFMCLKNDIDILNYLDDLDGCELPEKSQFALNEIGDLLKCCGIEGSMEKATPPSTKMVLIGILFDTDNLTISIDENMLLEIIDLVTVWLAKCSC